jgi:hypothetical protein
MNAAIDRVLADAQDVDGLLSYTHNTGVRPVNYTYDPPPGVPRSSAEPDVRSVRIHNARLADDLSLDVSGFELIAHRSSLVDWSAFQDVARVKSIDYPEVQQRLRTHTGADKVVIFDHTIRDSTAKSGSALLREPVRRVHDDQTLQSAPRRVARHLDPDEAAWRLQRRFAIVNFWRPIGTPVLQVPLALCDARSINSADLLPSDLVYPDWTGETYAFVFHPRHRWYWFPRQTPAEATLIKIYDSATDGRARLTAHTAFDLPGTTDATPIRRSIEVRAMLFW